MSAVKVTNSTDERLLKRLDGIAKHGKTRLANECTKLDPEEEQALAEEGLAAEIYQCPPY